MSAHALPYETLTAPWRLSDPGASGTLKLLDNGDAICGVKTLTAEARTVPSPTTVHQRVLVYLDTDGGDCTVTVNGGQGVTTVTLDDAGDWFLLEAITVGGTVKWVLIAQTGAGSLGSNSLNVATDSLTVNSVIVSPFKVVTINCLLNSHCVDQAFFTADRAYQLVGVTEIHATAGDDGSAVNVQVTKDTSTNAPGAGTDLLTNNSSAGFNMKGTANTLQTGTLTATAASLQLAAGDRLSLDFAGVVATLAGVQVTVSLKPI